MVVELFRIGNSMQNEVKSLSGKMDSRFDELMVVIRELPTRTEVEAAVAKSGRGRMTYHSPRN